MHPLVCKNPYDTPYVTVKLAAVHLKLIPRNLHTETMQRKLGQSAVRAKYLQSTYEESYIYCILMNCRLTPVNPSTLGLNRV